MPRYEPRSENAPGGGSAADAEVYANGSSGSDANGAPGGASSGRLSERKADAAVV